MLAGEELGDRGAQHGADRCRIVGFRTANGDSDLRVLRYFSHFANQVREWPGGMSFSSPNGS